MGVEAYEVGHRSDKRGADLISDALPFGRLWYAEPSAVANAIDYASFAAAHMMPWFAFTMQRAT